MNGVYSHQAPYSVPFLGDAGTNRLSNKSKMCWFMSSIN